MDYKFIDTKTHLIINGHNFILDIGEIEVGEKAEALVKACVETQDSSQELLNAVRAAIDNLLGAGAADKILASCSPSNEVQIRRCGMAVGGGINKKRTEMILSAFAPEEKPANIEKAE